MKTRAEIKEIAKTNFKANYWPAVGKLVLFMLILVALCYTGVGILVAPAFTVGMTFMFIALYFADAEGSQFGNSVKVGFNNFGRNLGSILLEGLLIYAWTLLFVVPGIIKSYAYAMTPYILADCQDVKAVDAITISRRMMKGHKWEFFVFQLSYIGWDLLTVITCGLVGVFYSEPWKQTAFAGYYTELKKFCIENGVVTAEQFAGAPLDGPVVTAAPQDTVVVDATEE